MVHDIDAGQQKPDMLDILTSHEKATGWNQQWHASHTVKINEK